MSYLYKDKLHFIIDLIKIMKILIIPYFSIILKFEFSRNNEFNTLRALIFIERFYLFSIII